MGRIKDILNKVLDTAFPPSNLPKTLPTIQQLPRGKRNIAGITPLILKRMFEYGDIRDRAVIAALTVGLKRHELQGLNVECLTEYEGHPILRISSQHTGNRRRKVIERLVAIPEERAGFIREYILSEHGENPLGGTPMFLTSSLHYPFHKIRITAKAIDKLLERVTKKASIGGRITTISFRRYYAEGLLRKGMDEKVVQCLLGLTYEHSLEPYSSRAGTEGEVHKRELEQWFQENVGSSSTIPIRLVFDGEVQRAGDMRVPAIKRLERKSVAK